MMNLKTAVSVDADNVAEWSKAPALGAGLARGVGSNPTVVTNFDGRGTIGELGGEPWAPRARSARRRPGSPKIKPCMSKYKRLVP